jgi:large subunit ribosomal protein L13
MGDYVVVINAKQTFLTGNKYEQKKYHWHTGWPGGLKEITYDKALDKDPTMVIYSLEMQGFENSLD